MGHRDSRPHLARRIRPRPACATATPQGPAPQQPGLAHGAALTYNTGQRLTPRYVHVPWALPMGFTNGLYQQRLQFYPFSYFGSRARLTSGRRDQGNMIELQSGGQPAGRRQSLIRLDQLEATQFAPQV